MSTHWLLGSEMTAHDVRGDQSILGRLAYHVERQRLDEHTKAYSSRDGSVKSDSDANDTALSDPSACTALTMPQSTSHSAMSEIDSCPQCGTAWRTTIYVPCATPDCWECDLSASLGAQRRHVDAMNEDAVAVAVWKCPHGTEWSLRCRGCGHEVSNWGVGAAGFGELCGCENGVTSE